MIIENILPIKRGCPRPKNENNARIILGWGCIVILAVSMYAGLTPFHSPKNGTTWVSNGNGLRFQKPSTVFSLDTFGRPSTSEERTLEIWVQVQRIEDSSTILA